MISTKTFNAKFSSPTIEKRKFTILGLLLSFFIAAISPIYSQQTQKKRFLNLYTLHHKWENQNKVIYPIGTKKEVLKAGWTVTEMKGGFTIQRTLDKDTTITTKSDSVVYVAKNWKIDNLRHTDQVPNKIFFSPITFTEEVDSTLNQMAHIPLTINEKVIFTRIHVNWSAITIPFSIRPAINGLNSQVTSELKIGTSMSLSHDWEVFKNRRIEVKRNSYGFSTGLGFGLGRVVLDNGSTSLSASNYEESEEGLILFITPGIGFNIRGFKILGFYGWDIGLTKNMEDWNYNRRPYVGLGLGFEFWKLK